MERVGAQEELHTVDELPRLFRAAVDAETDLPDLLGGARHVGTIAHVASLRGAALWGLGDAPEPALRVVSEGADDLHGDEAAWGERA